MSFKKISERNSWTNKQCRHPEHNPPGHICLDPGIYEWTCPSCGRTQIVRVDGFNEGSLKQTKWDIKLL
jgi:hypothetical protein